MKKKEVKVHKIFGAKDKTARVEFKHLSETHKIMIE